MLDYNLRNRAIERFNNGDHLKIKLLSRSNPKLDKSVKYGYLTQGLSLIPANIVSKKSLCPFAKGCLKSCLVFSGQGEKYLIRKDGQQHTLMSRALKTIFWEKDKEGFLAKLTKEISALERKAKKNGLKPCVRLNVYSDILWERYGIIQNHPETIFYNYSKIPSNIPTLPNNHVTFSRDETNEHLMESFISKGVNVSVVFEGYIPETYKGYKVIDGLKHDLRFLDPKGVVVGLVAKGSESKKDTSGFIVRQDSVDLVDKIAA